jgi:hypothetical protein
MPIAQCRATRREQSPVFESPWLEWHPVVTDVVWVTCHLCVTCLVAKRTKLYLLQER